MVVKKTLTTKGMVICAVFSALIAAGAFIKIPIPIVPNTLQFLFTNLAGLILGRRLGSISVGVYIALGLIGLPIFANGGGIGYIFQPTFGYIIGFCLGAWTAGFIVDRRKEPGIKTYLVAGFANMAVVYALGMVYFYLITNYYVGSSFGLRELVIYCFAMTAPGDVVICIISAIIAKRIRPYLIQHQIR